MKHDDDDDDDDDDGQRWSSFPLFHPLTFRPPRAGRERCTTTLYRTETLLLEAADDRSAHLAYAQLNDRTRLGPLIQVLRRFPSFSSSFSSSFPPNANANANAAAAATAEYCSLSPGDLEIGGAFFDSPYHDLFFRAWKKGCRLFDGLAARDAATPARTVALSRIQEQLDEMSLAFHLCALELANLPFEWAVDLNDFPSSCRGPEPVAPPDRIFAADHVWSLFFWNLSGADVDDAVRLLSSASSMYVLASLVVCEARFWIVESRARELAAAAARRDETTTTRLATDVALMHSCWRESGVVAVLRDPRNPWLERVADFAALVRFRYDFAEENSQINAVTDLTTCASLLFEDDRRRSFARALFRRVLAQETPPEFGLCDEAADFVAALGEVPEELRARRRRRRCRLRLRHHRRGRAPTADDYDDDDDDEGRERDLKCSVRARCLENAIARRHPETSSAASTPPPPLVDWNSIEVMPRSGTAAAAAAATWSSVPPRRRRRRCGRGDAIAFHYGEGDESKENGCCLVN